MYKQAAFFDPSKGHIEPSFLMNNNDKMAC